MDSRMQRVFEGLVKNNIQPHHLQTAAEVVPLVSHLLREGDSVTMGGSRSLFETGVIDHLAGGRYRFLNRYEEGLSEMQILDIYAESAKVDAYFCSCNAVTEAGELYNVDGNANRICAVAHGPRSVFMVVGCNKIVRDLDAAVHRVKTVVAPTICRLRGRHTPCAKTGHCVTPQGGAANMTNGCDSPERACCSYLVTSRQRIKGRIHVLLVDEPLGY